MSHNHKVKCPVITEQYIIENITYLLEIAEQSRVQADVTHIPVLYVLYLKDAKRNIKLASMLLSGNFNRYAAFLNKELTRFRDCRFNKEGKRYSKRGTSIESGARDVYYRLRKGNVRY